MKRNCFLSPPFPQPYSAEETIKRFLGTHLEKFNVVIVNIYTLKTLSL